MSCTVTLRYDPTWQALDWAKIHCASYITNQLHTIPDTVLRDPSRVDYFFANSQDATLFALRWTSV